MIKNEKGFTLIEMLVVIAIIGILSAAILVALGPSRNKAKDSRIISDIQQARSLAEANYNPASADAYAGVGAVTGCPVAAGSKLDALVTDVVSQNSQLCVQFNNDTARTAYAFYAALASDAAQYYCVDSAGNVSTSASAPVGGICSK